MLTKQTWLHDPQSLWYRLPPRSLNLPFSPVRARGQHPWTACNTPPLPTWAPVIIKEVRAHTLHTVGAQAPLITRAPCLWAASRPTHPPLPDAHLPMKAGPPTRGW